jgi:hypothetical protein
MPRAALVALLAADQAARFAARPRWTRTLREPGYGSLVEVATREREAEPAVRAVVTQFGGSQDELRVEVLDVHPEYEDALAVVADVRVEHDAANTVRCLRWQGDILHFVLDDYDPDEPGRPCSVDVSDWSVFARESVDADSSRDPR